jgi:hypothetical protein
MPTVLPLSQGDARKGRGELVVIRSRVKDSSSRVHRLFMLVSYLIEGEALRQTQRLHLSLGVGVLAFNCTSHRWRVL